MKKFFAFLMLAVLIASLGVSARAFAPYYDPGSEGQFYAVSFDEEGEATVLAKLVLTNYQKDDLKNVKLEIPGENIRLINIVQEWYGTREECVKYDTNGSCLEYQEYPDYQPRYSVIEPKVSELSKSIALDVKLPQPVESQDQAVILVYYKAEGLVEQSGNTYDFDFETIKVPFDLQNTRVAVTVSGDLFLDGGDSSTNYRDNSVLTSADAGAAAPEAMKSAALQDISNRVQWASGYVKTAEGLDPLESFHVEGKYAKSWFDLNKGKVFGSIAIALILLALLIVGIWKLTSMPMGGNLLSMVLTSVGSAVILVLLMALSWFLIPKFGQYLGYQYNQLFVLFYVLLAFLLGVFVLVGPGVYFGSKYGIGKGLAIIGMTLFFTILLALILALVFGMIFQSVIVQPPQPYYGGVAYAREAAVVVD